MLTNSEADDVRNLCWFCGVHQATSTPFKTVLKRERTEGFRLKTTTTEAMVLNIPRCGICQQYHQSYDNSSHLISGFLGLAIMIIAAFISGGFVAALGTSMLAGLLGFAPFFLFGNRLHRNVLATNIYSALFISLSLTVSTYFLVGGERITDGSQRYLNSLPWIALLASLILGSVWVVLSTQKSKRRRAEFFAEHGVKPRWTSDAAEHQRIQELKKADWKLVPHAETLATMREFNLE